MAPIAKTVMLVVGGTVLFTGSFVGVALMSGHKMADIPLLKNFAHAPEHVKKPHGETADDPAHGESPEMAEAGHDTADPKSEHGTKPEHGSRVERPTNPTALGAFVMPAPFTSSELHDMQARIAEHLEEIEATLQEAKDKAQELDEREHSLVDREKELAALKEELDRRTKDLEMREEELQRDSESATQKEEDSWVAIAKFYQEGEVEDLAKKLAMLEATNAAKILRQLDDERAVALVNALPQDKYKPFLDAYRKSTKLDSSPNGKPGSAPK